MATTTTRRRPSAARHPIGRLTEPLTLLSADPPAAGITTLERIGFQATATTATPHHLTDGDYVEIAGAVPDGYNGAGVQVAVVDATTFGYAVADDTLTTPATGSMTVDFRSDAQGGTGSGWWPIASLFGQVTALTAAERLVIKAVASLVSYRVLIHYQPDVTPTMRLMWQKYQEPAPTLLEIAGVLPHPDPDLSHRYLILECSEVQGT